LRRVDRHAEAHLRVVRGTFQAGSLRSGPKWPRSHGLLKFSCVYWVLPLVMGISL